jgi:hypothetical protein
MPALTGLRSFLAGLVRLFLVAGKQMKDAPASVTVALAQGWICATDQLGGLVAVMTICLWRRQPAHRSHITNGGLRPICSPTRVAAQRLFLLECSARWSTPAAVGDERSVDRCDWSDHGNGSAHSAAVFQQRVAGAGIRLPDIRPGLGPHFTNVRLVSKLDQ